MQGEKRAASAAKVPTVSEAKEFYQTAPIALAKKLKEKNVLEVMKVPTLNRNLGADWRLMDQLLVLHINFKRKNKVHSVLKRG